MSSQEVSLRRRRFALRFGGSTAEKKRSAPFRAPRPLSALSLCGKAGLAVLLFILATGVCSLLFMGDTHRVPSGDSLESPSLRHILGTDDLGIDIAAQLCRGALVSVLVGLGAAVLAGAGGSSLGMLAGYAGGWPDRLISGLCDVLTAIPQLPLMIVLGAFLGPSLRNIVFVVALLSWVGPARIARAKTLSMRREKFIVAAACYGASFSHIAAKHLAPALAPLVAASVLRIIGHAVVAEAGLTFLGLGDPTSKSWGMILNRSMSFGGIYFTDFWKWWVLPPLVALTMLVVSTAFIARDLEKFVNKKL